MKRVVPNSTKKSTEGSGRDARDVCAQTGFAPPPIPPPVPGSAKRSGWRRRPPPRPAPPAVGAPAAVGMLYLSVPGLAVARGTLPPGRQQTWLAGFAWDTPYTGLHPRCWFMPGMANDTMMVRRQGSSGGGSGRCGIGGGTNKSARREPYGRVARGRILQRSARDTVPRTPTPDTLPGTVPASRASVTGGISYPGCRHVDGAPLRACRAGTPVQAMAGLTAGAHTCS